MKSLAPAVTWFALCICLAAGGCGGAALAPDGGAPNDGASDKGGAAGASASRDAGAEAPFSPTRPDGVCFDNAFRYSGNGPDAGCTCDPRRSDVCGEACVDLASDDENCGACGHACGSTSACARGVCSQMPTSVVTAHAGCGEMRLAATADSLVWTDTAAGHVMAMPAAGGTPAPLSGAETSAPTLLAVNGSTTFWLDGKTIRKAAGGVVSDLSTNLDDVNGLAVSDDGTTVYFSTGQKVQSVPASGGGAPVDVAVRKSGVPVALAVSGSTLAFAVSFSGVLDVIRLGGPSAFCSSGDNLDPVDPDVACNVVASSQGEINTRLIVATDSKVIWADGPNLKMGGLLVDGVRHNWDTITHSDATVVSMAVANGVIYFNTSDRGDPPAPDLNVVAEAAMVANPDLDGRPPLLLARKVTSNVPGSLVVFGGKVSWATSDCAIQSVPTGPEP